MTPLQRDLLSFSGFEKGFQAPSQDIAYIAKFARRHMIPCLVTGRVRRTPDPGVARVYRTARGKRIAMACDGGEGWAHLLGSASLREGG